MLIFQTEHWTDVEPEIREITPEHWNMLALNKEEIPLNINWASYRANALGGLLHVLTARSDRGDLAAYYVSVVLPHPHYAGTLFGMVDAYYMRPEFRTPTAGLEFFMALEREMRKLKVKCLITTTKLHYDISPLLERCDWQPAGKTFTKVLV